MHSLMILNAIKKFCYLMFVDIWHICTHLSNSVSENVIIFNKTRNNSAFCNFHATEGQSRYLVFFTGYIYWNSLSVTLYMWWGLSLSCLQRHLFLSDFQLLSFSPSSSRPVAPLTWFWKTPFLYPEAKLITEEANNLLTDFKHFDYILCILDIQWPSLMIRGFALHTCNK